MAHDIEAEAKLLRSREVVESDAVHQHVVVRDRDSLDRQVRRLDEPLRHLLRERLHDGVGLRLRLHRGAQLLARLLHLLVGEHEAALGLQPCEGFLRRLHGHVVREVELERERVHDLRLHALELRLQRLDLRFDVRLGLLQVEDALGVRVGPLALHLVLLDSVAQLADLLLAHGVRVEPVRELRGKLGDGLLLLRHVRVHDGALVVEHLVGVRDDLKRVLVEVEAHRLEPLVAGHLL